MTVGVRRRRRVCSGCGARGLQIKDRRVKRWRHLDLGSSRCSSSASCAGCVALLVASGRRWWSGRAPARRTPAISRIWRTWLTQQMAKTQITRLLRIGWESVGKIAERVVADHLDEGRLDGLVFLGDDEFSTAPIIAS